MARIGSANIALLRPDFGDTNELFKNSMETLIGAGKPLQEAMASNFDYMKQQKVGELNNMLQQIAPQDPSNPQAMQEYLAEAQSLAEANGLNKWGINAGGAINVADKLIDRNQAVDKQQGANTLTNLANITTKAKQDAAMIENRATAENWSQDKKMMAYAEAGIPFDGGALALDKQTAAVGIANTLNASNQAAVNSSFTLQQVIEQMKLSTQFANASDSEIIKAAQQVMRYAGGPGMGKTQGLGGVPSSYTNNAPIAAARTYAPIITKYAQESGVSPSLINAMIHTESAFNPNARSPVGAQGLMQLMPGTAKDLKVSNAFNPEDNIRGGAEYIAKQIKTFGDLDTALMAYNWGPGNTQKWIDGGRDPNKIPEETRKYLNKVKGRMGAYGTGATLGVKPSDANNYNVAPNTRVRGPIKVDSNIIAPSYQKKLTNTDPRIAEVLSEAASNLGIKLGVSEGVRDKASQEKYVKEGKSQTMNSKHLHGGAVDFFIAGQGGKANWDFEAYKPLAAEAKRIAAAKGYDGFTWGGDWDTLKDGVHFEFKDSSGTLAGSPGSVGDAGYSQLLESLQLTSGNPNVKQNSKDLMTLLENMSTQANNLLDNSPKVDLNSSGLGFIGERTGSASDAMKLFDSQNKFREGDRAAARTAMQSGYQARTEDLKLASAVRDANYDKLDDYQANVARIMQEQAANAEPMRLSSFIGTGTRLEEGKSLLESAGFTQERMASLPPDVQTIVIGTTNQYLDRKQEFNSKNNIKLNKSQQGLYTYNPNSDKSPVQQYPKAYLDASIKNLDETSKADYMKWLEEETTFDRVIKGVARTGVAGLAFDSTLPARKRIANSKAVHKEMIERTLTVAASTGNEYKTTLRNADIPGIAKRAKEIYIEDLKLDDKADARDISGYSKRLINPGLYAEAAKKAIQENHNKKEKEREGWREDLTQIPLAEQIQSNLRKGFITEYKK